MKFKEALIAHLQGESVQVKKFSVWQPFADWLCEDVTLKGAISDGFANACQFRIAPRTIIVNGVEVPAPESVAPDDGSEYYFPTTQGVEIAAGDFWEGCVFDLRLLERGLVYLRKEDAIARAKAMLLTQSK